MEAMSSLRFTLASTSKLFDELGTQRDYLV